MDHRIELRHKYPGKGRRADHEGSRKNAIDMNCLHCMGGSRKDIKGCTSVTCFFYPFRPGAVVGEPRAGIPTVEEYQEMSDRPDPVWLRGEK